MADGEGQRPTEEYRITRGAGAARPIGAPKGVRKPTVIGVAACEDERKTDAKIRTIERLAMSFRDKRTHLSARTGGLERNVVAGMAAAHRKFGRISVVSVSAYRQTFNALPCAVRDEALAGLRTGIEKGIMITLPTILHDATGYLPVAADKAMVAMIRIAADKADAWFMENASDIVPKAVTDAFRLTIGLHAMAVASDDPWRISGAMPFTELWRAGHIPVGVLTDNSFLVIVE
ncbi:MAG TPA: hypothetical protein VL500_01665 [Candidatus Eisenbacteria bacterium]|nr:hypothetical protein [Candidatus Eisenbacteria bacterium]